MQQAMQQLQAAKGAAAGRAQHASEQVAQVAQTGGEVTHLMPVEDGEKVAEQCSDRGSSLLISGRLEAACASSLSLASFEAVLWISVALADI